MPSVEQRLLSIENILKRMELQQSPKWISEAKASEILQRGKVWLKKARNGTKDVPAVLIEGFDWQYLNGRSPEYKASSINELKRRMVKQQIKNNQHANNN